MKSRWKFFAESNKSPVKCQTSRAETAVVASSGSVVDEMWEWQSKGAPLVGATEGKEL
jgi:hypothetical protein